MCLATEKQFEAASELLSFSTDGLEEKLGDGQTVSFKASMSG